MKRRSEERAVIRAKARLNDERERPTVALVGRPNVGKSTLFNRLVGGHNAIVEDEPGVTRDRRYGVMEYDGREVRVVDTGGLDLTSSERMTQAIQRQALRAVEEATLLLLVMDAQSGIGAEDREVIARLRKTGKPLLLVANKVDGERHEAATSEFFSLGVPAVYGISAAHGRGLPELLDAIVRGLPRLAGESTEAADHDAPAFVEEDQEPAQAVDGDAALVRIAFVGRPNAGKSSLVNALLGDERMIVDDTPGTTRDPVDTLLVHENKKYLLIDTAGIRRRARIPEPMEKVAVAMAERALYRADVAVLVIDGKEGIGEQDARIAGLIQDSGRALVIAYNKQDVWAQGNEKRLEEDLERKLQFVAPWALTMSCSALQGRGLGKLLDTVRRCYRSHTRRVGTGALNRFFEGIVERHPPPLYHGRPIKLYYITQAETCPPTFVISVNHPDGMHFSYRRYLQNQLREAFKFEGTPVRVIARERS